MSESDLDNTFEGINNALSALRLASILDLSPEELLEYRDPKNPIETLIARLIGEIQSLAQDSKPYNNYDGSLDICLTSEDRILPPMQKQKSGAVEKSCAFLFGVAAIGITSYFIAPDTIKHVTLKAKDIIADNFTFSR